MDQTRKDLSHCHHFTHINVDGGRLLNQMHTDHKTILVCFPDELSPQSRKWATYHFYPGPFGQVIMTLKRALAFGQCPDRRQFFIGNRFRPE